MKTKPLTFLLALTFLFLFSGSVYGQEEVKKEYWHNGKLKSEKRYKDEIPEGLWTEWYENGRKSFEKHFKDGNLDGLRTNWTKSGKKRYEARYKNGEKHGRRTIWWSDGMKHSETHYKNGKENGVRTEWDVNGKITFQGNFVDGNEISDRIRTAESPPSGTPQPPKSEGGIAAGTGFLFGSQDYIITNYHVVKGTSEVKVKFTNEEMIDATVVARDTQNDIAVLKLTKSPSFQSRAMKFGDSSMVRMGDKVFTIGYPSINIMGLKPKYTEGVISAVTGIKDNPTVFQTTVPIQPGNSGGPLFNDKGEVVGLTTSSLSLLAIESMGAIPQSVNYAVKSSFVKNVIGTIPEALLSNRGIVVVPTDSNSRSDFIEAISKNVVLILGKVD